LVNCLPAQKLMKLALSLVLLVNCTFLAKSNLLT
jgi:hypothetical protein